MIKIKIKIAFPDPEGEYEEMKKWQTREEQWGTPGSLVDLVVNKIGDSDKGSLDIIDLDGTRITLYGISNFLDKLEKLYTDAKLSLIELNRNPAEEGFLEVEEGKISVEFSNKEDSWGYPSKEIKLSYKVPYPEESNTGCFILDSPQGKSMVINGLSSFINQIQKAVQIALNSGIDLMDRDLEDFSLEDKSALKNLGIQASEESLQKFKKLFKESKIDFWSF
jgi:hypothetical protein